MKKTVTIDYKTYQDLTVKDLTAGFVVTKEADTFYTCIFCGESFEEGIIYSHEDTFLTAEKAMEYHIKNTHGGVFQGLLSLDKSISGITENQKNLLRCLYEKKNTKQISLDMNINPSTVRTHKFHLQRIQRQSKIFLALMEIVETILPERDKMKKIENVKDLDKNVETQDALETEVSERAKFNEQINRPFALNSLHPFFTQYKPL